MENSNKREEKVYAAKVNSNYHLYKVYELKNWCASLLGKNCTIKCPHRKGSWKVCACKRKSFPINKFKFFFFCFIYPHCSNSYSLLCSELLSFKKSAPAAAATTIIIMVIIIKREKKKDFREKSKKLSYKLFIHG
jgi:hypothetical protein